MFLHILLFLQVEKKTKTTVLTAALLLSGIPAEVINRSMDTYRRMGDVFADLCVYFFTFILSHEILQLFGSETPWWTSRSTVTPPLSLLSLPSASHNNEACSTSADVGVFMTVWIWILAAFMIRLVRQQDLCSLLQDSALQDSTKASCDQRVQCLLQISMLLLLWTEAEKQNDSMCLCLKNVQWHLSCWEIFFCHVQHRKW